MTEKAMCSAKGLEYCEACSKKILGWTVAANVFLAAIKLTSGVLANSSGLFADGLQSLSCIATSIFIMVSLALSRRKYDEKFPYGYAKLEFIVAFLAFSILIGLGFFIALSGLLGILRREFVQPDIMALPVAVISIFLAYMIYRYNFCAGAKLDSPGMIANGCHAGADLYSSGAVILALIISQLGPEYAVCDKIAAMLVGIIIIKDALHHWVENLQGILDYVPDPEFRRRIEKVITTACSGCRPGAVKFRRIGKKFWVGIGLSWQIKGSVREADALMDEMRFALTKEIPAIGEIDFFMEPAEAVL